MSAGPLADIEGFLARHEQKELVRFTTVGSVDDGKSTLIGRLLHDTGSVFDDQLRAVRKASVGRVEEEIDFSLFTDGLLAEREQGITIDVAYRYFSTETRKFIIADTPGHEQYTRNMATGASTADIAIILIDARLGVLAQSRRHATIASLLGISQLVVAVNKMDLVDFAQGRFAELKAEFAAFTAKLHFDGVSFVPVSAKRGDNVVAPSDRTPWYGGPTLLGLLETLPVRRARPDEPFRFPVQSVVRPNLDYRGFAGFVARGIVRAGDEVVVLPSGRTTRIASVDTFEGSVTHAPAPLSVTLRLTEEVDVSRGEMIAALHDPPVASCDVTATLVWLSERAFDPHRKLLLKHTSRWVPARVAAIEGRRSLGTLELEPTTAIQMNDIAVVRLHTTRPIFTDPYAICRVTGAFILVDALDNGTVAAGMVSSAIPMRGRRAEGPVTAEERAERLGHRAAAVALAGEAVRVERALFERGVFAVALEPQAALPEVVGRLCSAGLVVLLVDLDDAQRAECLGRAELALDMRATSGDVAQHILEIVTAEQVDTGAGI
ncbi:MAG: GTP-binding protein [Polyangiaceae bacterium]|nr:GTP-binding protein [Polyangiaceae bacterium]